MKAEAERVENNRVALQIEVDAERVDEALEKAYRKVAQRVSVPGFRKGRVPRKIIEARYGVEVLYEEALDELVPEAYREALETTDTEAIDQPDVSDVHIEPGTPLRFKAEVDVMPEAELGEYKGVEVEKLIEQVEESDIDHALEHLQDENATQVTVERTEVQNDDFVVIDFEGFVDGQPFQGGAANGYTLQIGSEQFIPGFEEQLIGAEVGKEVDVEVTFPEDYPSDELKGKEALFKVTVQSIKVRQVPELDDDFAVDVGDAATLLELRSQLRSEMEEAAADRAEQELRDRVVETVRDASEVDVPAVLVDREVEHTINEFARRLAYQGIDPQRYLDQTGKSVDDLKEQFRPDALQRVKTNIVLQTIIKREGITVDEEELEAKIAELADENGDPDRIRQQFANPEQRSALKDSVAIDKVVDFLVEQAKVEEKEIPSQGHGHHHHDEHDDEEPDQGVHEEENQNTDENDPGRDQGEKVPEESA